ncbi:MAG TPA: hypothetical protein VFT69_17165 [Pseudolabrys sp.]|nr:hypothetical protein [Pseudolabrys sp.]
MTITYPLAVDVFADKLNIASLKARPGHQQELSGMGSGALLAADVAPALREFDVTCNPMYHDDAAEVLALIEALGGSIGTFYLYDPRHTAPKADPGGSILGSSTVTISSLNANNKAMKLTGLPSGYVLTAGDMLAWDYSTDPVRRACHRVIETVTADSGGTSPEFEVRDFIRPGSTTGTAVTLIKPAMKCVMVPKSLSDDADGMFTTIGFSVRQVI